MFCGGFNGQAESRCGQNTHHRTDRLRDSLLPSPSQDKAGMVSTAAEKHGGNVSSGSHLARRPNPAAHFKTHPGYVEQRILS